MVVETDHNATSHTIVIVRLFQSTQKGSEPMHSIDHTTDHHWTKKSKKQLTCEWRAGAPECRNRV